MGAKYRELTVLAAERGGWVVSEFNSFLNAGDKKTFPVLFAGDITDCLNFIEADIEDRRNTPSG